MKKVSSILFVLFMMTTQATIAQMKYPESRKEDITDDYFGTKVTDPYRWLEDDNSAETKVWSSLQNALTFSYLSTLPDREKIGKKLESIWNYPREQAPYQKGEYLYYSRNDGLQNQAVIFKKKGDNGTPEVFMDPNKFSTDGTVSMGATAFSKSGKYYAYALQSGGSDWQEGYVMDVKSKTKLSEKLQWLKFTGFSWNGDDGFYYTRYPEVKEEDKLKGKNVSPSVYYHKVGTPQSSDVMVYNDPDHPQRFAGGGLTEDFRFLVINISEGTSGSEIRVKDLKDPAAKEFRMLVPGFKTEANVIDNVGDKLLLMTNEEAPNNKLVLVDPKLPAKENWKVIIPEKKDVLQYVSTGGGYLFAGYLQDASSKIYQYRYDGTLVREIPLPGIGTVGNFSCEKEQKYIYYTFTSYNYPPTHFKYDIENGITTPYKKSDAKVNPEDYEVKQVFFNSKDGTRVPIFLTYRKGMVPDGNQPVLLTGYGGFNIAITPSFSIPDIFFVQQGGILAEVCLRGGSEYGEEWHKAGMLDKKQNVFDDFIGAAEWLITNKYTNSEKIAIMGGSNGGLLVGAVVNQRPDLFQAAIPMVGVMDMLRYHKFTIGYAWAVEYGSSEKREQFEYLYKYSPLHNLKKGTEYPAVLVTTADHDDRVVPAHSFKYIAALQEAQAGSSPVLIRIETRAGHGGGMPVSKAIQLYTDIYAFVMNQLRMKLVE